MNSGFVSKNVLIGNVVFLVCFRVFHYFREREWPTMPVSFLLQK